MIRLGLCCIFIDAPIKFRRTTATYQSRFSLAEQRRHLADLCMQNTHELLKALTYCHDAGIGAFRINSQILPLITHPRQSVEELVYQAMVADWVGADVINIHAGGAYGDKPANLKRLVSAIKALPAGVTSRNRDKLTRQAIRKPVRQHKLGVLSTVSEDSLHFSLVAFDAGDGIPNHSVWRQH